MQPNFSQAPKLPEDPSRASMIITEPSLVAMATYFRIWGKGKNIEGAQPRSLLLNEDELFFVGAQNPTKFNFKMDNFGHFTLEYKDGSELQVQIESINGVWNINNVRLWRPSTA